jgi:hypothetical protein
MTETLTLEQASRELREDHRKLDALIEALARAEDPPAMARALGALHGALASHFNEE